MRNLRDPIRNGELQTDLDAKGYIIRNLAGIETVYTNTLIVDSSLTEEFGVRGTTLPFRTLAAAVAVAQPGDLILMRPGIHAYDGVLTIQALPGLQIIGYGAIIKSNSLPDEVAKLLISNSDNFSIEGVEFDGETTSTGTDANGCIAVYRSTQVMIRNCRIHDQAACGIRFMEGYARSVVRNCMIDHCSTAITAGAATNADTIGLGIESNFLTLNRDGAINLTGPGVASGVYLSRVRISSNELSNNAVGVGTCIALNDAVRGALITGNYISLEGNGIVITKCKDVTVIDNILRAIAGVGFGFIGCQGFVMDGNLLDGLNDAGNPITNTPVEVSGFYENANDSGPGLITSNALINLETSGEQVTIANTNNLTIATNRIDGPINIAASNYVSVIGNFLTIPSLVFGINIDAMERGVTGISISVNRFNFTGASIGKAIRTEDNDALGIDDVSIIGNESNTGLIYGTATYGHVGANQPTNVSIRENSPISRTRTVVGTGGAYDPKYGWVNEWMPELVFKTVLVSQKQGDDETGARERGDRPFNTINAAIADASFGDTVLVKDGTFNEQITAKSGITVRFRPEAALVCTTAEGCLISSADAETFTLYHEHAPISSAHANRSAVSITHAGIYFIFADIRVTGTGASSHGITSNASSSVSLYGSVYSEKGNAINSPASAGFPFFRVFPVSGRFNPTTPPHVWANSGVEAIALNRGGIGVEGGFIYSGAAAAIYLSSQFVSHIYKRCTITSTGTGKEAVRIIATGSSENVPLFRDCTLISEATATDTISTTDPQDVTMLGTVMGNKGADPPTDITILGGGVYTVNADVIIDFF